ncbi:MAG TPA: hypothetical protein VFT21_00210 [Gemmatimonadaceae bacterium]|nr:hypothetical protein [Gemmatimonadaceae bacterium]
MRLGIHAIVRVIAFLVIAGFPAALEAQKTPELAPNAPPDKPVPIIDDCQMKHFTRSMQPFVDSARATWPAARARFLNGLPPGNTFFVTVRLTDQDKRVEQVFLVVDSVRNDRLFGRIRSPIQLVRGYRYGQPYDLRETEIIDWMVARPDGSEEGNVVGKFMDTYRPPEVCKLASRPPSPMTARSSLLKR